jgi:ketosteroid isomerase-like protein
VVTDVRRQLETRYEQNRQAFMRKDLTAIMALRADDFHAVAANGETLDRERMHQYIEGLLNGIERWDEITFTIDSLGVSGDTATAIVSQYLDRRALRPDTRHRSDLGDAARGLGADESWLADVAGGPPQDQRRLVDGKSSDGGRSLRLICERDAGLEKSNPPTRRPHAPALDETFRSLDDSPRKSHPSSCQQPRRRRRRLRQFRYGWRLPSDGQRDSAGSLRSGSWDSLHTTGREVHGPGR